MTRKSKREIEQQLDEIEPESDGPTLAEVWERELTDGETCGVSNEDFHKLLRDQ